MNFKKFGLTSTIVILVWALANGGIVKADDDDYYDDDYEDYEDYEYDYDEEYDDDYDYDEEYEYYNDQTDVITNMNTWHIWTRTTVVNKGELPFHETKLVQFKLENEGDALSLYVIPLDGELFVPGKAIAEMLGAEATLYDTSEILEVTTRNTELLFRAGTNVVYDNKLKSPMPATAFYMNDHVYIPISVITNGLGYVAEWQEESDTVVCKSLAM
ncbi:copper amine oxidase N-terminal domain-containing protein [Lysinibacillus sp. KU-BSD001]|uniref:copper amine oxidase N-terminal domain-containing protein n=1 Tax=Lysinibacillus sp. KU-BSD001 TaxID=3141328 RepID=UPI0036EDAC82